jgi:hypothetical protein
LQSRRGGCRALHNDAVRHFESLFLKPRGMAPKIDPTLGATFSSC